MKKWYTLSAEEVLKDIGSEPVNGLSKQEALKRQESFGKNEYEKQKKQSIGMAILHQLKDVSTIVLLFAAFLSLVLAIRGNGGLIEPIVIFGIIILNVTLAITQERSAERALEALADLNSPNCFVLREGSKQQISTSEVVPGDIILLQPGALVPADARLIESNNLSVDESALTGESEASEKSADLILEGKVGTGDQKNMLFSGCLVTAGRGKAVVTATGMNTEMGKIASYLKDTKKRKTPLQKRLDSIGKTVSIIAVAAGIFLFVIGLIDGEDIWSMLLLSVSLAVAAVPETLSLIVTLALTQGVQTMVKQNTLIRKLPAVETLGNTSVICSDKTGTLTQNQMSIQRMYAYGLDHFEIGEKLPDEGLKLLELFALASNASTEKQEDGSLDIVGDATETAIIRLLGQQGINRIELEKKYEKVAEIPFSSSRKMMTMVFKKPDGKYMVLSKGAVDRLPINSSDIKIMQIHDSFAEGALRILALGKKEVDKLPPEENLEELEKDLTFCGFIGLIDPPRPEAIEAVEVAKRAGIRTIMITGDHAATAKAIAENIGILEPGQKVLTGSEMESLSDEKLEKHVQDYSVYARVSPEDKIRIVQAWQTNGKVVAMTGDGVNDAPALKAADVGVAMGKNGTEVAKSASDMILTDDKFSTIVKAVEEGRNVYLNIQKTIYFLLVCNLSELIVMLVAQLAGWGILATPIMLLLVNVLGDGIPGLQLAKEPAHDEIMEKQPVERESSFFRNGVKGAIVRQTIACSVSILIGFYLGAFVFVSSSVLPSLGVGQTIAFLILGWTSMLHIFNVRSNKSLFSTPYKENPKLVISALIMIIVFALFVLLPPLQFLFGMTALSLPHWIIAIVFSLVPTLVSEVWKAIAKYRKNKGNDKALQNDFV